jgi:hypothetical protein
VPGGGAATELARGRVFDGVVEEGVELGLGRDVFAVIPRVPVCRFDDLGGG